MADETIAPSTVDPTKTGEETTRNTDAQAESAAVEVKPVEGGDVATGAENAEATESAPQEDATNNKTASDNANPDVAKSDDDTGKDVAVAVNGTPTSTKKGINNRRKSGANIGESKKGTPGKKTPGKKKAPVTLHLNVEPGELWFVAMRGFPPWPVIICDEEMLPEALLSKRPVSAKRIDGTYREDFLDGGKNAKDRRYPVMFLGTNEFAWQVNTELQPLDLEAVKKDVEEGNNAKKSKNLWDAYQIAAEGHDLAWFKEVLDDHEQAMQIDTEAQETAAATKKETKKGKRKSQAVAEEEEEAADDAGTASAKKAKVTKKRKKETDSDGEPEKPAKTPKTTKLKLNAPKEASAAKPKKETKPKKSKAKSESAEAEVPKPQEPPLTEAERWDKQYKSVLYLRHKLQKGFISREDPPHAEEMPQMSLLIKQLENTENLGAAIIKKTKVHKVLKGIIKLDEIPRESEFDFKKRSTNLLNHWAKVLSADTEAPEPIPAAAVPATNGVKHDAKPAEAEKAETKPEEKPAEAETTNAPDGDGDVTMAESKEEPAAAPADTEVTAVSEIASKVTEEVATT